MSSRNSKGSKNKKKKTNSAAAGPADVAAPVGTVPLAAAVKALSHKPVDYSKFDNIEISDEEDPHKGHCEGRNCPSCLAAHELSSTHLPAHDHSMGGNDGDDERDDEDGEGSWTEAEDEYDSDEVPAADVGAQAPLNPSGAAAEKAAKGNAQQKGLAKGFLAAPKAGTDKAKEPAAAQAAGAGPSKASKQETSPRPGKETGKSKKAKADGAGGASGSGGSGAHPSSNGVDEVTDDEDSDGVPGLTSEEEEVPRMRYTLTDNFPINGATPAPASAAANGKAAGNAKQPKAGQAKKQKVEEPEAKQAATKKQEKQPAGAAADTSAAAAAVPKQAAAKKEEKQPAAAKAATAATAVPAASPAQGTAGSNAQQRGAAAAASAPQKAAAASSPGAAGQKQKAATVRRATADMDDDDDDIPDLIDDEEPLSSLTHGAHPTQAVPESDASDYDKDQALPDYFAEDLERLRQIPHGQPLHTQPQEAFSQSGIPGMRGPNADADVRRRRVEEKLRRKKDEGVEFNGKLHDVYNKKELAGAEKKLAELKAKEEAAERIARELMEEEEKKKAKQAKAAQKKKGKKAKEKKKAEPVAVQYESEGDSADKAMEDAAEVPGAAAAAAAEEREGARGGEEEHDHGPGVEDLLAFANLKLQQQGNSAAEAPPDAKRKGKGKQQLPPPVAVPKEAPAAAASPAAAAKAGPAAQRAASPSPAGKGVKPAAAEVPRHVGVQEALAFGGVQMRGENPPPPQPKQAAVPQPHPQPHPAVRPVAAPVTDPVNEIISGLEAALKTSDKAELQRLISKGQQWLHTHHIHPQRPKLQSLLKSARDSVYAPKPGAQPPQRPAPPAAAAVQQQPLPALAPTPYMPQGGNPRGPYNPLGRPMGFQHQQPVVAQQQPSYNPTAQPYVVPQPQPPRQVPGWPAPPPRQTTPGFGTQTTGGVQLVTPAREYRQPPPPQQPAPAKQPAALMMSNEDEQHILDEEDCCVCLERPKDIVFYPCGHQVACKECSEMIRKKDNLCPVCRVKIKDAFSPTF